MKTSSRLILQIGLAITFFVIGCLILQDPIGWGSLIQPWAMKLIPGSLESAMRSTAYLDLAVGILFLFRGTAWIAGMVGAIHLLIVVITVGIPGASISIRDIGLLAASLSIAIETFPASLGRKLAFWRR